MGLCFPSETKEQTVATNITINSTSKIDLPIPSTSRQKSSNSQYTHFSDVSSAEIAPDDDDISPKDITLDTETTTDNQDGNNNHNGSTNNHTYSPKLRQVAQMVDLNGIIPEETAIQNVNSTKIKIAMQSPVIDSDSDNNSSEENAENDVINEQMTMYDITDEMKQNLDTLIEAKVNELRYNEKYIMTQCAFSTIAGKKNGKTKTNQDSYFVYNEFGPSNILQFFGVADGHGPSGHDVSKYCADHLPQILVKDKQRILTTLNKPAYALIKSFEELELKLDAEKENDTVKFDTSASGTTISCGLRVGNYLYLANLGDSRAVMGHYDFHTNKDTETFSKIKVSSKQLTADHDPKNKSEQRRISASPRGKLLIEDDGSSRIQINLMDDKHSKPRQSLQHLKQTYGVDALKHLQSVSASVSRSIGDRLAHKYGGVISKPDVIIHKLCSDDLFCMWASDGIWTVIDNGDVTRIIGNKLKTVAKQKVYDDLQKITDKIVREAHIVWQDEFDDYVDDITAVIARIGVKK